jgi:hypothetical protein
VINLNKTYFIGQVFPGVALKYEFYADELYFDRKATKVRYRIFSTSPHYHDITLVAWSGLAKDNVGNNYDCVGGVCDYFGEGNHTEGVISFSPLLDCAIDKLDFELISAGMSLIISCNFTVNF